MVFIMFIQRFDPKYLCGQYLQHHSLIEYNRYFGGTGSPALANREREFKNIYLILEHCFY